MEHVIHIILAVGLLFNSITSILVLKRVERLEEKEVIHE